MKRATLLVALVSGVVLTSVLAGSAIAVVGEKETTLTIAKAPSGKTDPGDKVLIFGRLKPTACQALQTIKLIQVLEDGNQKLKTGKTASDGEYSFKLKPKETIKVFTKFPGSVDSTYEGSLTCLKSKSDKIKLKVTG
jgi:hypothetical protein